MMPIKLPDSWLPSVREFIVYLLIVVLTIVLIRLFHHNKVQKTVRKESRCLREQKVGYDQGVYSVTAFNNQNSPMYTISYDIKEKTTDVKCACKPGTITNTFDDIKYFNLRDPSGRPSTKIQKVCQCSENLEETTTYYSGYPGLVRYMYSDDRTFFDNALDPNIVRP